MRRIEVGSATDDVDWVPGSPHLVVLQLSDMRLDTGVYHDLFLLKLDGTRTNITRTPEYDDVYPDVSPDGTRVVFTAWIRDPTTGETVPEIRIVNIDGTDQRTLAAGRGSAVWSPDGCRIVFAGMDGLTTMAPDGSNVRLVGSDQPSFLERYRWSFPFAWQPITDAKAIDLRLMRTEYINDKLYLRVRAFPLHALSGLTLTLRARDTTTSNWQVVEQLHGNTRMRGGRTFVLTQPTQRYCKVSVRFVGDHDHRPTKKSWPIGCHG